MRLLTWLSRRRFPYEPLITVSISRGRLLHNIQAFRKSTGDMAVAPVLKSNAYGHGLIEVAEILDGVDNIPFLVVDSYFEAVALRARHLHRPILIMGYTRPETIRRSRLKDCAFTVTSLETLSDLRNASHDMLIHLKIDTGMRRQGILPEEVPTAIDLIHENPYVVLDGAVTHLSDADNPDESFTESQTKIWNRVVKQFKAVFPRMRYFHATATDGSRFSKDIEGNVLRLGIGMYGLSDNALLKQSIELQPVLEMRTIVTGVKKLRAGETVGYGNTFKAQTDMTIATIPVGYYEGVDRRLSNNGFIQLTESRLACPIIGRVSMNITTIDVSAVPTVTIGTEATVVSRTAADSNSIESIAKRCGSIAYEFIVHIPAHLKREVVD